MPVRVTSEQLGVQGLGWFVRRTPGPPAELMSFYANAWGLSAPRGPSPAGAVMLWGGDLSMFEISSLTPAAGSQSRLGEMSVLMGTADFPKALGRMRAAGASLIAERPGPPRRAALADPKGHLLGLMATQQFGAAVQALPDVAALPPEIGGIARIAVRVGDPPSLAEFYRRALGLLLADDVTPDRALLSLGRGVELELRSGGHRHDPPGDRREVPDVWILRVLDHDGLAKRLQSMGARVINRVEITGGILTYAVDPEGHLFGIQQRTPDLLPAGREERVEDTAARTAWAARTE